MSFSIQDYPKLKNAITKNNLVVFVGAGTSINLENINKQKIGTWNDLVKQIVIYLNQKNSNKYEYLIPLIGNYEPIDVLNLIEKNKDIEKRDIYDFLKDYLDLGDNDLDLHKKIIQLSNIIVTTNYDTAFENCSNELSKRVAYKGKDFELATHKEVDKPLLFKLHGCFKDSDSMVLFPSNYNELYNNPQRDAQHTLTTLKNLVFNRSILFIGFGMGDFQINHIFKEIKTILKDYNEPHFILSTTRPDLSLDFLTHISIKDHSEISNVVNQLIDFKISLISENENEKLEKQKQIDDLSAKLKENESKYRKLIEELFEEGLEFNGNSEHEKAIKKYQQICYIDRYSAVYTNWGFSLHQLSLKKEKKEKIKLLKLSCEKYKQSIELYSEDYLAYYNLGISLNSLANESSGKTKINLLLNSCKYHNISIEKKPEYFKSYLNCGASLIELAKINYNNESDKYYKLAENKILKSIEKGGNIYNLSCLYALQKNKTKALEYLDKALTKNELTVKFVLEDDDDWIYYRQDPDFIDLIEKYKAN